MLKTLQLATRTGKTALQVVRETKPQTLKSVKIIRTIKEGATENISHEETSINVI